MFMRYGVADGERQVWQVGTGRGPSAKLGRDGGQSAGFLPA